MKKEDNLKESKRAIEKKIKGQSYWFYHKWKE